MKKATARTARRWQLPNRLIWIAGEGSQLRALPNQQVLERIHGAFSEMPGLRLRAEQVQRLCGVERLTCQLLLDSLVEANFLCVTSDGAYARQDGPLRVSWLNGTMRYCVPSSKQDSSHDDRRGCNRPANGDKRPCPACGAMMRFREWYVVTHAGVTVTLPAWVCSCGDETFARPSPFDRRAGSEPGRPPSRSMDPW